MSSNELTDKQLRFCEEYLVDYNATQAAIRAGYSPKRASEQGYQQLQKTTVQAYLKKKAEKVAAKLEVSQERTLLEIARLTFGNVKQFFNEDGSLKQIHELDDDTAAAIASFEIEETTEESSEGKKVVTKLKKVKRFDKAKPLEMAAKYLKMYSDSPTVHVPPPLSDNQVDRLIEALRNKT